MKNSICRAFCQDLSVRELKNGFAISTPFDDVEGNPLGFYAIGPGAEGRYRIIDSGATVAFLEAAGVTFDNEARQQAFAELLMEYGANYDDESGELVIPEIEEHNLPKAALGFMALLLRIRDFLLVTRERVESTFREDVITALKEKLTGRATVEEEKAVSLDLEEITPDLLMYAKGRETVALFIASSERKVHEAIHLQMIARHEAHVSLKIIVMLEQEASVSQRLRQRADNRLDAVPRYRRDEKAAIERVIREVVGSEGLQQPLH